MMIKKIIVRCLCVSFCLTGVAFAQDALSAMGNWGGVATATACKPIGTSAAAQSNSTLANPAFMLCDAAPKILSALDQYNAGTMNKEQFQKIIYVSVESYLDVNGISREFFPGVWVKTPIDTQNKFIHELLNTLVNVYSDQVDQKSVTKIDFFVRKGALSEVDSTVSFTDGTSKAVKYHLIKVGAQWRVNELSVDGIPIIHNMASQFPHDSVEAVIEQMEHPPKND